MKEFFDTELDALRIHIDSAFVSLKLARNRMNAFRNNYELLAKTLRLRQKELDCVRDFLRECNMLDYYENFVKDHRRDGDRSGVPAHHQAQGPKPVDDLPFC